MVKNVILDSVIYKHKTFLLLYNDKAFSKTHVISCHYLVEDVAKISTNKWGMQEIKVIG